MRSKLTPKLILMFEPCCQLQQHISTLKLSTTCRDLGASDMPPSFCSVDFGEMWEYLKRKWCEFKRPMWWIKNPRKKPSIEVFFDCKNTFVFFFVGNVCNECQEKPGHSWNVSQGCSKFYCKKTFVLLYSNMDITLW